MLKIEKIWYLVNISGFFGKNNNDETRFRVSWFMTTISFFDLKVAERIDKDPKLNIQLI